ncbi:MAG: SurA N-terminal domain-containing protein [Parvularculales bacterium]
MLKSLREIVTKWIIRLFIGVIALSFAIWGIADIFQPDYDPILAEVGGEEIPASTFQTTLRNNLYTFSQFEGRPITLEEARSGGLGREVLNNLIQQALLNESAHDLGLSIPNDVIVEKIKKDGRFVGASGEFERTIFDHVMRNSSSTEATYVDEQRRLMASRQLVQALTAGIIAPASMADTIYRYANEIRVADYIELSSSAIPSPDVPDEAQLRILYDDVKESRFISPEVRALDILVLNTEDIRSIIKEPTEEELQEEYKNRKSLLDIPERRAFDRLTFSDKEQAQVAIVRIDNEEVDYDTLVTERGFTLADIDSGLLSQDEILGNELAETVFALGVGEISKEPVKTPLGAVLPRLREIASAQESHFEEERDDIRDSIVNERTLDEIYGVRDLIEDSRGAGESLEEATKVFGFSIIHIPEITEDQTDLDGNRITDFPNITGLLPLAFELDVGEESLPGDTDDGGFYWIDIVSISPEDVRPFEDEKVRTELEVLYRENFVQRSLEEWAEKLVRRGNDGESFERIAEGYNLTVKTTEAMERDAPNNDFTSEALQILFETPQGEFNWGINNAKGTVFVLRTHDVMIPTEAVEGEALAEIEDQLKYNISIDMLADYIAGSRDEVGVSINQTVLERVLSGEPLGPPPGSIAPAGGLF